MPAPTYTETLNELYATTWALRKPEVVDQIFTATPFFYLMKKNGRMETMEGGRWIEHPVNYAKNETTTFIGKGGNVTLAATDTVTTTHWDWKYLTGHIIRYFADFQKNRGKAQLIQRVNHDIDVLRNSLIDECETALWGDGTGDGSLAYDGLGNIIANTNTNTVGGLSGTTYSWWRNQTKNMSGEAASVYLIKRMRTMFNDCGKYGEGVFRFPDHIVGAQDVYELYEEETLEIGRILMGDKKMADLGFGELAFKGRPITWSPAATAGELKFLNTSVLKWVSDPIGDFELGEWLPIVDQPRDVVAHTMSVGNMVTSNRRRLGAMYNIAE